MASVLHALARSPVKRAVHLQISPRPASIAESSEIMRILSRFGTIEYYKSFKYDLLSSPKTAVVVFREETAAAECLRQSPIQFHLSRGTQPREVVAESRPTAIQSPFSKKANPVASSVVKNTEPERSQSESKLNLLGSWGLGMDFTSEPKSRYTRPSHADLSAEEDKPTNQTGTGDQARDQLDVSIPQVESVTAGPVEQIEKERGGRPQTKAFTVLTSPAHINFREHINNSRLANGFAIDTKSAAQRDLAGRVPHIGLSDLDWRTEISWRYIERAKRAERDDPNRKTLRQLYDESVKESQSSEGAVDKAVT